MSASFRICLLFAWPRSCQGQETCTQSERLLHINSPTVVILKVGSTKQGQGFRKATFVRNWTVISEHSCQSCEYIPRLHVERRSISKTKGLDEINFVKYSITKQDRGFRKATFLKNSAMNSEHSCQSCEYIPRLHVKRQSISKNKGLHDINFVK